MRVRIKREVAEFLCEASADIHPRESIFLLRGVKKRDEILVEEAMLPPFPVHGYGFSGFSLSLLPFDPRLLGTAHSHPSGSPMPSLTDLNKAIGRILLIISYPYRLSDIHAFDTKGRRLEIKVE